ncbi:hypothetical protein [Ectopseudomonas toyotomiensis]|uniref:Phage ABA sandwich domain-containing protein n=1 Tax=Ectopseudomonas toyotomiensis TaxID=554344 RepID=A0AA42IIS7_9GAMM|nr:hypothetical protein [Pseudomonas toyotomiensis]MBG0839005.1 hypothetical protein [Pseudomonas toyotomiensis]MDH0699920.1 hypothetical protein [Pseudomonas toyotomiensis]
MSDRELLELAAKAYGDPSVSARAEGPFHTRVIGYCEQMQCEVTTQWNPLTDDGDALRLAVRLGIAIEMHPAWVYVRAVPPGDHLRWLEITEGWAHTKDPESCVRRAIVRAAAEIGKAGAK